MKQLLRSVTMFTFLTLLTSGMYPLVVTGVAQLFPRKASGSLLYDSDKLVGSELIAQKFADPRYFHCRPSASDFATLPSGASNAALTNRSWQESLSDRKRTLQLENPEQALPADLLAASASGLDPHISPAAAQFQIRRIAGSRGLSSDQIQKIGALIEELTEKPQFGILGEERVNVLLLNLRLDKSL
ncbi:MAG: potassium-transporting ATPase subunit KdpC [Leptospirales bacterium]|nr:potassium-transporting ATPase subunit KdpC [Leptospirales bacterium]